jgi:hypothetical protein
MKKLLLILLCLPFIGFASFPINTNISSNKCDTIILKNGDEILVNIIEIRPSQIAYEKCNNEKKVLRTIYKEDVLMIKYSDGTNEIIKSSKADSTGFTFGGFLLRFFIGMMIGALIIL